MPFRRAAAAALAGSCMLLIVGCTSSSDPMGSPATVGDSAAPPTDPVTPADAAARPLQPVGTSALSASPPPPAGISTVIPAPAERLRERRVSTFGVDVDVAVGPDDQPVVAFTTNDPSSRMSTLHITRWDGHQGQWTKPVELQRGTLLPSLGGSRPFDLVADRSRPELALVVENQDERGRSTGATLHLSSDGGRSWSRHTVAKGEASGPAVAITHGFVIVTYRHGDAQVVATAASSTEALEWVATEAPVPDGFGLSSSAATVTAGPDGEVALLYPVAATAGPGTQLLFWRLGNTATATRFAEGSSIPSLVTASDAPREIGPAAAAFSDEATIAVNAWRDHAGRVHVEISRSTDGGQTWGPTEPISSNGADSSIFGLSLDALGNQVALSWVSGTSGDRASTCGLPRVAVVPPKASEGSGWTTCGLPGGPTVRTFEDISAHPALAFGPRGDLYLAFSYWGPPIQTEPGVVLWRGSLADLAATAPPVNP
jgi:hypothetical protein